MVTTTQSRSPAARLGWLAGLKALALLWIVLNHIAERLFGSPYIANPTDSWPPLAERVAQLAPLPGTGLGNLSANLLRYVGWLGDQGVQLFLIASGFGLTWGLLSRAAPQRLDLRAFFTRRVWRLYPLWLVLHLGGIAVWFLSGKGLSPLSAQTWVSMTGLRLTPGIFYYFAPAWWFFGLLLQLYLLFPLLWYGLRRLGPTRLLALCAVAGCLSRAVGLLLLRGSAIDWWSRGGVAVTRLPEFALGIALAAWLFADPAKTQRVLRSPATLGLALLAYLAGNLLSLTLLGMAVAPFVLGASLFVLCYALLAALRGLPHWLKRSGAWLGDHSYSIFLVHHPIVLALVPASPNGSPLALVGRIIAAVALSVGGGFALERLTDRALAAGSASVRQRGLARTLGLVAAVGLVGYGALFGADAAVRRWAPQEALGWGERPSLVLDAAFGWHLRPSQTTHLRWESYDYTVTANALGFPGPDRTPAKPNGLRRVLVAGDAFSSAEGVDTAQSWPSLLEQRLGASWQVLNFAITGYGPDQEAATIAAYAPIYRPDLIVVEAFINDGEDVLSSDTEFRSAIGFDRPDPDGLVGRVQLPHLRQYLQLHLVQPLRARLRGQPAPPIGYFWGGFGWLERDSPAVSAAARARIFDRYGAIRAVAEQIGARLIVVVVPAAVQVCRADQLDYYPANVNLADASRYDLEQPQRMFQDVTAQLAIPYVDLRPVLKAVSDGCPYQRRNLHWLPSGHQAVAEYLAEQIAPR